MGAADDAAVAVAEAVLVVEAAVVAAV